MTEPKGRDRLDIMREILAVTTEMHQSPNDVDFLISSVERRQLLMEEFELEQGRGTPLSPAELDEIKALAREATSMDADIAATLEGHKQTAKFDLAASNHHQRVLGYAGKAMSPSGSYMDFKK